MNIQSSVFPKIFVKNNNIIRQAASLERTPSFDTVSFKGNEKIDDKVKEMLDTTEFEFKKDNGEIFKGTIKDYFENSIIRRNPAYGISLIHCTSSKEVAQSIIKNGLDWHKTGRMKCGPGTYFAPSAYAGMEQGAGSVAIEGIYTGDKKDYPVFEKNFYVAVDYNNDIHNAVKEITSDDNTRDVVNKYCHDLLQDDMGIDFLYASSGYGAGAYAVINNDCMKLSAYNW